MPATFDATAKGDGFLIIDKTFSHTMSASANGALMVSITWSTSSVSINSVTFNGVAMALISGTLSTRGSCNSAIYGLMAPASGTHDIVVTMSGTATDLLCASVSAVDVSSLGNGNNDNENGGVRQPTVVITGSTDDLVMDACSNGNGVITSSKTIRQTHTAVVDSSGECSTALGAGSVTMGYTGLGAESWCMSGAAFKGIPAGGAPIGYMLGYHR